MAQNQTAFDPRVFDPHVFQIFGGQPVGPPHIAPAYEIGEPTRPRRKLRRVPIKAEVLPLPPSPLPPPVPPAALFAATAPEQGFVPSMTSHDVSDLMRFPQQIQDAKNMQDVLDALAAISAMEIA